MDKKMNKKGIKKYQPYNMKILSMLIFRKQKKKGKLN